MRKRQFRFKERHGWESHNGNGGSTYLSSCTFYVLYVDGKEEKEFDRKREMYEYINKKYFPKKWAKDQARIEKLRKDAKEKENLAREIEQSMTCLVYG